jgi:hypothetical protein
MFLTLSYSDTHLVISVGILDVLSDEANGLYGCRHFGRELARNDDLLGFWKG